MKALGIVAVIVWSASVAAGARMIYSYSTTSGSLGVAPERWPMGSSLTAPDGRASIVMFVHPDCPCTRASLSELGEIAEAAGDRATIRIVMSSMGEAWTSGVSGARVILDPLELEATRFGALTSGHVVVYDPAGNLRYAGGITGSRGHAGDNIGRRTVERIIAGSTDRDLRHPVFGCAL